MLRKSRRHLRKSFSRTRSEDELVVGRDPTTMPPLLPPFATIPLPSVVMGVPPIVQSRLLSSLDSRLVGAGGLESSEGDKQGNKEKIREWIQEQVGLLREREGIERGSMLEREAEGDQVM